MTSDGQPLGTVAHVWPGPDPEGDDLAEAIQSQGMTYDQAVGAGEGSFVEVQADSGSALYIPLQAIRDASGGDVVLDVDARAAMASSWANRPANLADRPAGTQQTVVDESQVVGDQSLDTVGTVRPLDAGTATGDRTVSAGMVETTDARPVTDQESTDVTTQSTAAGAQAAAQPAESAATDVREDDVIRVQRYEEELQAGTVERQAGEVRVTKDVVQEERTLEVPVEHERVSIESRIVDRPVTDSTGVFESETISVPLREEDVDVRKEVRVAEELDVEKTAVEETRQVSDTVREERINVERTGDAGLRDERGTDRS
jgi:uncharacterized protein (TIGR02271 family)